MLDEWTVKPKYVHPVQIDSLNDLMKQFIAQSFYPKIGEAFCLIYQFGGISV
uniref:DUF1798 family protein n=1 Tax=Sporosarcina sp. FSL K6-2383 TaxID=2921556 RepID=UPI00406C5633